MDLERGNTAWIGLRRERIAAALAVLEQEVDVLAGEEAEVLVHRQAQAEHRDVGRGLVEALDAARDDARPHAVHFAYFDGQVGERLRLAKERQAFIAIALRQVRLVREAIVDASLEDRAAAGAA